MPIVQSENTDLNHLKISESICIYLLLKEIEIKIDFCVSVLSNPTD